MRVLLCLNLLLFHSVFLWGQVNSHRKIIGEEHNQASKWVDSVYTSLSLEDKIAQLFMVAAYVNKDQSHTQEVNKLVTEEHIGGLILMQDDVLKQVRWINELQKQVKTPLLIGIDGEWGLAQRFTGTVQFPWSMTLGAVTDDNLVYEIARQIGIHCKRAGINWDFAPVVDINVNPNNPIIGNRSFGSDKNNVVQKAKAYMRGLQSQGILSSAKHFPGHGDTDADSHLELPVLKHTKARFDSLELYPFKKLIAESIDGIMVAHLNVPAIEKDPKVPASLSYNVITKLLKEELGYKGMIITDALNMQGVAKNYPYGEMDYLAFKAGNDILLFSQGVVSGKRKIKDGIENGDIPMSRLEESVKKILYAKYHAGLNKGFIPIPEVNLLNDLNDENSEQLKEKLFTAAITELKSAKECFPLNKDKKYLFLPLENGDYQTFYSGLKEKFPDTELVTLTQLNSGKYDPKRYELIIGIHKDTETTVYYSHKLSQTSQNAIANLSKRYTVTLCNFISPYSLNGINLSSIKNVILTYQNNNYTQKAIIGILDGTQKAKGKLPVEIAGYKFY
ncbi:MAG: glycoside hydrolase family 3 protein [Flavobacteriaceae bacterium]|jgi:beta-glucosidase-like glycosyl hydrolase|nr:glycoside hydrolase family 3 protein [Flavobacteriaceae bacterium]